MTTSPPTSDAPQPRVAALVVAAGRGSRAGPGAPKQYRPLAGRTVLAWTLAAFLNHPRITSVRVVIHPDFEDAYQDALGDLAGHPKLLAPCPGGGERQDSVRLGLESFADDAPDRVLIHDAARPFITDDVINRVVDALDGHAAALAALPIADTLKRAVGPADAPRVDATLPREQMWRAQTPQGFQFGTIVEAHRAAAGRTLTDDAAVAEAFGVAPALVLGAPDNMKITQAEDFGLAETLIRQRHDVETPMAVEYRTGQGFDVHAFEAGDHVMVGGVRIAHDAGLAGHSDADVGLHAITDAVLGAIGAGDIGQHFPPSDPRWAGADSAAFLAHAGGLAAGRDAAVVHVDLTVIGERPKIGPHREAIRARIASILNLELDRVSVKATTTEKLGFTGRREGLAAMATATVRIPDPNSAKIAAQ